MKFIYDGKIIRLDGTKIWLQNNKLHNFDGPAVIYPNGEKEYSVWGMSVTKELIDALQKWKYQK